MNKNIKTEIEELQSIGDRAFTAKSLYGSTHEPAFSGALSFMRRNYQKDLTGVDIAVIGVPFDLATSNRPGTRMGPKAIRESSANLSWGEHFPWGFDPFTRLAVIDYGDVVIETGNPQSMVDGLQSMVAEVLAAGAEPLCLGGDHYIALPILRELAKVHGPLSLVHFDAHTDTEEEEEEYCHGTMFKQAVDEGIIDPHRSVQIGIRTDFEPDGHHFTVIDSPWIHDNGIDATLEKVKSVIGDHKAYLSFDIDCLDPSFAPGTGTPVVGGLSSAQVLKILRNLKGINFVGMDMVEVSPTYDVGDITAMAAASFVLEYLCLKAENMPDVIE